MSDKPEARAAQPGEWQPRITAFVCRWCTYAGADLAGTSRLKYPPQIRMIKLPCTGRIDPLFLLRSFEMGSDAVLVSGCHPGDCHYTSGNYAARRRWVLFRELLDYIGFETDRMTFSWVSAAEGAKFVDIVKQVTDKARALGPFQGFGPGADALMAGYAQALGGGAGVAAGASEGSAAGDIVAAMKAGLGGGAVRAILGHRGGRRGGQLRAAWATDTDAISGFDLAGAGAGSLITHLVRRLRADPEATFGVVAGPIDRQAVQRLIAEHQIDPARVKIYERGGPEAARGQDVGELYGVPSADAPREERWAFWSAAFARCFRCYACREGCPMCSCLRCVTDKTRPRWIDSSATPAGNWIWNVTRAFHQAGRCVECGACTDACPVQIPLAALTAHLNRVSERVFGPAPEGEAGLRSPLLSHRLEDEAPFIL